MHAFVVPLLALLFLVPGGGWLGVYLAADRQEAVVTEVVPDSPAQKAGLEAGDVILAVGDKKTARRDDLVAAIGEASPGDRVKLTIQRGDERMTVTVKLGRRPEEGAVAETAPPVAVEPVRPGRPGRPAGEAAQEAGGAPFLGVAVTEGEAGVGVDRVLDDSPAEKAGLRAGDRLLRVGDHRVKRLADLDEILRGLRPGRKVEIQVENGGELRSLVLVPGRRGAAGVAAEAPPEPAKPARPAKPAKPDEVRVAKPVAPTPKPHTVAETKPHTEAAEHRDVQKEIDALRAELENLRKQLAELRQQLRRQRR